MGTLTSFAAGAAERNPDHCGAGGVPYPGRLVTASSTGPVTGADLADEAKQATTPHQITHAGTTILARSLDLKNACRRPSLCCMTSFVTTSELFQHNAKAVGALVGQERPRA